MKDVRVLMGHISLAYQWALSPTDARFFDELRNKRIMGTKCPKCGRVLVPARKFCPRCFVDTTEWVEVSDEGVIVTSTLVGEKLRFEGQPIEPPYGLAVIKLDGADVGFSHFIGGIDFSDPEKSMEKMKPGTRVKAVWNEKREGKITDIKYFKPLG
ncbi:hypothetical protein DRP04_00470 [Archaeoglobales archaeon]|nr:MAG: hypothetical protein DRP04_00470 [Archaeoglobales archaeon]HDM60029.1 Zn-ribbon domain-containing OB-fold protein [Archaeoglobus veneficus]